MCFMLLKCPDIYVKHPHAPVVAAACELELIVSPTPGQAIHWSRMGNTEEGIGICRGCGVLNPPSIHLEAQVGLDLAGAVR